MNIDLDQSGSVVGIDIDQASHTLDLSSFETSQLPVRVTKAA